MGDVSPPRFKLTPRLLITRIEELEQNRGWTLHFSSEILCEICGRYEIDINRYPGANLIKQAAVIAFWIKKLKPIQLHVGDNRYANELFAYVCAQAFLKDKFKLREELYRSTFNQIFYSFRYRFTSPQSTMMVLEMLFYKKNNLILDCPPPGFEHECF